LANASKAFDDAGLYILRHEDSYLILSAGPNGQNGNGGHAHNDKLSIELYAGGHTWIADPGTCVYTADYALRNLFRSTAYHNTIQVDGAEQNEFPFPFLFTLPDQAQARLEEWYSDADHDRVCAAHVGYRRLPSPVVHKRQVELGKARPVSWLIQDRLEGEGSHEVLLSFHAPKSEASEVGDGVVLLRRQGAGAEGCLVVVTIADERLALSIDRSVYYAPGYGQREPSLALRYQAQMALPAEIMTALVLCESAKEVDAAVMRARALAAQKQRMRV
jgi:uncharacterized heparinase superfamily protein